MMFHDTWHTLEVGRVEEVEYHLSDHDVACPTYPDGPEPGDCGYGCATAYNLDFYGIDYFDEMKNLEEGIYRIRYWCQSPSTLIGGELENGMDVEKIA